jgi:hypothetical protein
VTRQGDCCPVGQVAAGSECKILCPDPQHTCDAGKECLQISYDTEEQSSQLLKDLGDLVVYHDKRNIYACEPPMADCQKRHEQDLMPASVNNTQLGYDTGKYSFKDGDLCHNGDCIMADLLRGASVTDVNDKFRSINELPADNLGQWCGEEGGTFMVRSVRDMENCSWKRCLEELSYDGLQRVRFDGKHCVGLFTPVTGGISTAKPKDLPCRVLGAETSGCLKTQKAPEDFCKKCLSGTDVVYKCDSSGALKQVDDTVFKYFCAGRGDCQMCWDSGTQPSGKITKCSEVTTSTYNTYEDCAKAETLCQGTCKFKSLDEQMEGPWWGLCANQFLGCNCECGKLPEIWHNASQDQRDRYVSTGNACARGLVPCPNGNGNCTCTNFLSDCYLTNYPLSDCGCSCVLPNQCKASSS